MTYPRKSLNECKLPWARTKPPNLAIINSAVDDSLLVPPYQRHSQRRRAAQDAASPQGQSSPIRGSAAPSHLQPAQMLVAQLWQVVPDRTQTSWTATGIQNLEQHAYLRIHCKPSAGGASDAGVPAEEISESNLEAVHCNGPELFCPCLWCPYALSGYQYSL